MTKFLDTVTIAGTKIREDGALLADARIARSGIQIYAGFEVGKPDVPIVRVYRPADEVFSKESMSSFAHRPITNNHPSVAVTADNWKEYAVGNTADEVARDGEMLRVPLMVSDAAAIADIQNGKRELSAGYSAKLEWGDGVTPDGEPYNAIQRDIRANHVAIVNRARAGYQARIGDDSWSDAAKGAGVIVSGTIKTNQIVKDTKIMDTVKMTVDGITIETTEQGKQVIDKLTKQLADATALVTSKDAELAKKDAELDATKAKVLDAAALDAAVVARGDLIATANKIAPKVETKGLSDADIRKAVVIDKLGADAVKDKSEAYIDARFDIMCEDAKGSDDANRALGDIKTDVDTKDAKSVEDKAHSAMIARFDRKKKFA